MPTQGVYVTFDDGPHSSATDEVLKALQAHKAAGTFFLTGQNIAGRESLVREIAAEGHTVGIHGFAHSRLPALSIQKTREEIIQTEALLHTVAVKAKHIYRPPYGFFSWSSLKAAKELEYRVVLWTALSGDFRKWSGSKVVSTALKNLSAGSVLVFHDNESTKGKIGSIVSECVTRIREAGFQLQAM